MSEPRLSLATMDIDIGEDRTWVGASTDTSEPNRPIYLGIHTQMSCCGASIGLDPTAARLMANNLLRAAEWVEKNLYLTPHFSAFCRSGGCRWDGPEGSLDLKDTTEKVAAHTAETGHSVEVQSEMKYAEKERKTGAAPTGGC